MNPAAKTCGNFESTPASIKIIREWPARWRASVWRPKSNHNEAQKSRFRKHETGPPHRD
jgi:hypothetical protein